MSGDRLRLDALVQQRAGVTRSKAQGLIRTGFVRNGQGEPMTKPGSMVSPDIELEIADTPRYVSRGGEKLEAALKHFPVRIEGVTAVDIGASTGGFTDCLLQHGAAKIYAVDVGYGQLDWKLRQDPRAIVMERTNFRNVDETQFPSRPNFFTADCSFISLRLLFEPLRRILADCAEGIVLIKPQFEAGKDEVGKGGVVRDPGVHERVLRDVLHAAESMGFQAAGVIPSPLLGPAGNREFLAHLKWPRAGGFEAGAPNAADS
jgi:23S rRNA (cytidine1920-2'-O)/16S rRNA (cytidine1409-2'-O)-methyltransferase